MGRSYEAKCLDCGNCFNVDEGGGFMFEMVRCDLCGRTSQINTSADERGSLWSLRTGIDHDGYKAAVEQVAGKCKCGGHFKLDAPPRCPNCKSANLADTGKEQAMYD